MVDHTDALIAGIDAIAKLYVGETTLEETQQRVADLANTISGSDMVGVTMLVAGQPRTAVSTDEIASEIDDSQYSTGTGPCLDACRSQHVQRVDATDSDDRWPEFGEAAAARGIFSSLSLPLVDHDTGRGALNCYSRTAGAFSPEDERNGSKFAAAASVALANSEAYWDARHLSERLDLAMQSRATIEQAKGILMAAQHCGPDPAFEILVRASQRQNRKLRDIADELVRNTAARHEDNATN
jgi:GAF domain-containing protein